MSSPLIRFSSCPCCGSRQISLRWKNVRKSIPRTPEEFHYGGIDFLPDIAECNSCGFHFLNEICENEELFYGDANVADYLSLSTQRKKYFLSIKNKIISIHGGCRNYSRLLDLGCASGDWLNCWPDSEERWGVEVNNEFSEIASGSGINIIRDIMQAPDDCDLISAFDFVEHTINPAETLSLLGMKLSKRGVLIIGVPNMGKIMSTLLGRRYYLYCPMHYSYFTHNSLKTLLSKIFYTAEIDIFPSPIMHTSLAGALKWVSYDLSRLVSDKIDFPLGYSASLIATVRT